MVGSNAQDRIVSGWPTMMLRQCFGEVFIGLSFDRSPNGDRGPDAGSARSRPMAWQVEQDSHGDRRAPAQLFLFSVVLEHAVGRSTGTSMRARVLRELFFTPGACAGLAQAVTKTRQRDQGPLPRYGRPCEFSRGHACSSCAERSR